MNMEGDACIANIGPGERRKRQRIGVVMGAVGVLLTAALWAAAFNPWARAIAFVPFFVSAIAFFQATEKT